MTQRLELIYCEMLRGFSGEQSRFERLMLTLRSCYWKERATTDFESDLDYNKQELSCRIQKASRLCKIIRSLLWYSSVHNLYSKSPGYYSTVESTFKSSVTTKKAT